MSAPRAVLLDIYRQALAAVEGGRLVRQALATHPLDDAGEVRLAAVGKAALAMARGAHAELGARITDALIITKHGYLDAVPAWATALESAHPLPDESSLRAGEALLDFVAATPAHQTLLFLLSGGASALIEAPRADVAFEDLQRAHHWLLGSGLAIDEVNRVRMRLSRIKGGGLQHALARGVRVRQILLSDVPGDDAGVIGSGPLIAPAPQVDRHDGSLPSWLRALLAHAGAPPAQLPRLPAQVIAGATEARAAAQRAARAHGMATHVHDRLLCGDALVAGQELAAMLGGCDAGVLQIWSGETTVVLPGQPGEGGRCQSLALAAAVAMSGREDLYLLAAGTDGGDGPGPAAGALVDGGTVGRGRRHGFDAEDCLRRADAGAFLRASADLIVTGPSGSNVMDLVLGWRCDDARGTIPVYDEAHRN